MVRTAITSDSGSKSFATASAARNSIGNPSGMTPVRNTKGTSARYAAKVKPSRSLISSTAPSRGATSAIWSAPYDRLRAHRFQSIFTRISQIASASRELSQPREFAAGADSGALWFRSLTARRGCRHLVLRIAWLAVRLHCMKTPCCRLQLRRRGRPWRMAADSAGHHQLQLGCGRINCFIGSSPSLFPLNVRGRRGSSGR